MSLEPSVVPFGTLRTGEAVSQVTLKNETICCQVITYGAALRTLYVPDRDGHPVDVVLGYDTLEEYVARDGYLGATVGRFANRIAGGRFVLNGEAFVLAQNDGNNHLHGGQVGFSHRVWDIASVQDDSVTLTLHSPDGEEGYPGNLDVSVTYTLKESGLFIRYQARSDRDTVCSLTNHSYFNLAGHGSGDVLEQRIAIHADHYTPSNGESIPLGTLEPVEGTPMDLRTFTPIGTHINDPFPQLVQARGYDHNYAINPAAGALRTVASASCEQTGISMKVNTTMPGMHFYTANFIDEGRIGKDGCSYGPRHGFCLETQQFPDAPNQTAFPSAVLEANQWYDHITGFLFGNEILSNMPVL